MKQSIRKVLLINPFCTEEEYDLPTIMAGGQLAEDPIGLRYLVSYLKEKDPAVNVKIYDANLEAIGRIRADQACDMDSLWKMLGDEIARFQPDLVGISCLFHYVSSIAHHTCSVAKAVSRDIITVMGGAYPTVSFHEALEDPDLDYAILFDGEAAFANLIAALNNREDPRSHVDGFAFRDGTHGVVEVPRRTAEGIDSLPWPDRTDLLSYAERPRHYAMRLLDPQNTRIASMVGSRGCPFKCTFCNTTVFWGNTIRHRSVDNIVEEMEHLNRESGISTFIFNDDNISTNKNFFLSLCNSIIRSRMNIQWLSGSGLQVSTLTEEVVQAMHDSGFAVYNLAIETGSGEALRRIKKPLRPDMASKAIERIRKCYSDRDVYIIGMFIVGFPFEKKKDIENTLEFAASLDLDWKSFSHFQPFPGTVDYDECVEKGYIPRKGLKYGTLSQPCFSTEQFSAAHIEETTYLANLQVNFIRNRNLEKGAPGLAARDFQYVLRIDPRHAVAHFSLARAFALLGENDKADESYRLARTIATSDSRWRNWFKRLDIDIDRHMPVEAQSAAFSNRGSFSSPSPREHAF